MGRRIYAGADHGGWELKDLLVARLREQGWEVEDLGTNGPDSVDYPRFAAKVSEAVRQDPDALGLLVCGTGVGMAISANKVQGIRAVVCSEPYSAEMARRHNNANVLCMGGRVVGPELGWRILQAFLFAPFEGGRHQRRVELIARLDETRRGTVLTEQ